MGISSATGRENCVDASNAAIEDKNSRRSMQTLCALRKSGRGHSTWFPTLPQSNLVDYGRCFVDAPRTDTHIRMVVEQCERLDPLAHAAARLDVHIPMPAIVGGQAGDEGQDGSQHGSGNCNAESSRETPINAFSDGRWYTQCGVLFLPAVADLYHAWFIQKNNTKRLSPKVPAVAQLRYRPVTLREIGVGLHKASEVFRNHIPDRSGLGGVDLLSTQRVKGKSH
jgi:hypothetical protein